MITHNIAAGSFLFDLFIIWFVIFAVSDALGGMITLMFD